MVKSLPNDFWPELCHAPRTMKQAPPMPACRVIFDAAQINESLSASQPGPTVRIRLLVLEGNTRRPALAHLLPAYARGLPDERAGQRERLEANAALVIAWSDAAGVRADGDAWSRHAGGAPRPPAAEPRLSLSHTRGLAAVALCADADIGVDLERMRGARHLESVAVGALAPEELREWRNLPASAREKALLVAWTRKEAVLKALGSGLAGGLRSVVLDPGGTLRSLPTWAGYPAGWTLAGFAIGADAWGAVAVRHPTARVAVTEPEPARVLLRERGRA